VRVYDDIQDLVEELQIIETIMRQQRAGLESCRTLCTATNSLSDAFALQVFQKGLRRIDKQLNNVTELLQLAEDKKALVRNPSTISTYPIWLPPDHIPQRIPLGY
jgi:hypothetical protein